MQILHATTFTIKLNAAELAASKPYLGLFVTPEKDKKSQNHAFAPFDISLQGFLKSMKLKNLPEIRHPEADAAQAMVRQQMNGFGLQTITKILQPGAAKYPLRKVRTLQIQK